MNCETDYDDVTSDYEGCQNDLLALGWLPGLLRPPLVGVQVRGI